MFHCTCAAVGAGRQGEEFRQLHYVRANEPLKVFMSNLAQQRRKMEVIGGRRWQRVIRFVLLPLTRPSKGYWLRSRPGMASRH